MAKRTCPHNHGKYPSCYACEETKCKNTNLHHESCLMWFYQSKHLFRSCLQEFLMKTKWCLSPRAFFNFSLDIMPTSLPLEDTMTAGRCKVMNSIWTSFTGVEGSTWKDAGRTGSNKSLAFDFSCSCSSPDKAPCEKVFLILFRLSNLCSFGASSLEAKVKDAPSAALATNSRRSCL